MSIQNIQKVDSTKWKKFELKTTTNHQCNVTMHVARVSLTPTRHTPNLEAGTNTTRTESGGRDSKGSAKSESASKGSTLAELSHLLLLLRGAPLHWAVVCPRWGARWGQWHRAPRLTESKRYTDRPVTLQDRVYGPANVTATVREIFVGLSEAVPAAVNVNNDEEKYTRGTPIPGTWNMSGLNFDLNK